MLKRWKLNVVLLVLFVVTALYCSAIHAGDYCGPCAAGSAQILGHYEERQETALVCPGHYEQRWVTVKSCDVCGETTRSGYWEAVWVAPVYARRVVRVWVQPHPAYYSWPALDDSPRRFGRNW